MKKKPIDLERLPIYEIELSEDDPTQGIKFISFVDKPAIEVKGMCFSNEDIKEYQFKTLDEKQIIAGPALIPNKKILREDDKGNMYYVRFSKEAIEKLVDRFNKNESNKSFNDDHTSTMVNSYTKGSWIIEDPSYDKSRFYGFNNLPVGTFFIEVKVNDKDYWENEIKGNKKFGFSIEGILGQRLVEMSKIVEDTIEDVIDSLSEDELKEIFKDFC